MTAPRLTKRRTVLERHRAEVIGLTLDHTDSQVARFYQVSREAVGAFRQRHADEIAEARALVDAAVLGRTIAEKAARIEAKDQRWHLLEDVRQARAAGGTGMETGLVVRQYKALGSGKSMQVVEEYAIDTGMLAALDRLEHSAAEELAQLPKPETNIQIMAQNVQLKWDND